MELPEFLLARITEDEAAARNARPQDGDPEWYPDYDRASWHTANCGYGMGEYMLDCDCDVPSRVLAEGDAKRRIVDLHALARTMGYQCVAIDGPTQHQMADPCATLRILALPYADHPDYCEEWRP